MINPTSHLVAEFPIPTPSSYSLGITAGPDGNLWFTENGAGKIGQVVIPDPPPVVQSSHPSRYDRLMTLVSKLSSALDPSPAKHVCNSQFELLHGPDPVRLARGTSHPRGAGLVHKSKSNAVTRNPKQHSISTTCATAHGPRHDTERADGHAGQAAGRSREADSRPQSVALASGGGSSKPTPT